MSDLARTVLAELVRHAVARHVQPQVPAVGHCLPSRIAPAQPGNRRAGGDKSQRPAPRVRIGHGEPRESRPAAEEVDSNLPSYANHGHCPDLPAGRLHGHHPEPAASWGLRGGAAHQAAGLSRPGAGHVLDANKELVVEAARYPAIRWPRSEGSERAKPAHGGGARSVPPHPDRRTRRQLDGDPITPANRQIGRKRVNVVVRDPLVWGPRDRREQALPAAEQPKGELPTRSSHDPPADDSVGAGGERPVRQPRLHHRALLRRAACRASLAVQRGGRCGGQRASERLRSR